MNKDFQINSWSFRSLLKYVLLNSKNAFLRYKKVFCLEKEKHCAIQMKLLFLLFWTCFRAKKSNKPVKKRAQVFYAYFYYPRCFRVIVFKRKCYKFLINMTDGRNSFHRSEMAKYDLKYRVSYNGMYFLKKINDK